MPLMLKELEQLAQCTLHTLPGGPTDSHDASVAILAQAPLAQGIGSNLASAGDYGTVRSGTVRSCR